MALVEDYESDYNVSVKDGKLFVENRRDLKDDTETFWRKVMLERYLQLEGGSKPIVESPTPEDKYSILRGELRKGVLYKGKSLKRKFDDVNYDFMIGKKGDLVALRQINGNPLVEEEVIGNKFLLSHIKSNRRKQIDHMDEGLPKNTNVDKYIDDEIKRGIILNGVFVSSDKLLGITRRNRRR